MSTTLTPIATCPLCDAPDGEFKFEKDGAPIYACPECTFRFARPERNANLGNAFDEFESSYIQYFDEAPRDTVNFERLTAWMAQFGALDAGATVLDVGAGSGKFVRYLRRMGMDATGLEPSAALYQHYLAGDAAFRCQKLAEFSRSEGRRFSIVTAFDVIEHVDDPVETIALISELAEPGGRVFVSTPDTGSLHARVMGRHWHYYHRYHLSYWSRSTLGRTAAKFGLECRYFGRRSRYQTLGYVLAYFWEHFIGGEAPRGFRSLEGIRIPINLFDVMYLCFEKVR